MVLYTDVSVILCADGDITVSAHFSLRSVRLIVAVEEVRVSEDDECVEEGLWRELRR